MLQSEELKKTQQKVVEYGGFFIKIPEDHNYIVTDGDLKVWSFSKEPQLEIDHWVSNGGSCRLVGEFDDLTEMDYIDSLVSFKSTRWRAEVGKNYFFINSAGYVQHAFDLRSEKNARHYALGNYFKNKEEAQLRVDYQCALMRVNDFIINESLQIQGNMSTGHYRLLFDECVPELKVEYVDACWLSADGLHEIASKELAEKVIAKHGYDLETILTLFPV